MVSAVLVDVTRGLVEEPVPTGTHREFVGLDECGLCRGFHGQDDCVACCVPRRDAGGDAIWNWYWGSDIYEYVIASSPPPLGAFRPDAPALS